MPILIKWITMKVFDVMYSHAGIGRTWDIWLSTSQAARICRSSVWYPGSRSIIFPMGWSSFPKAWFMIPCDKRPSSSGTSYMRYTIILTLTGLLIFQIKHVKHFDPPYHYFASSQCCSLGLCCIEMPHTSRLIISFLNSVTLRSTLLMAPWRTSLFTTCLASAPHRFILLADLQRSTKISAR